jgi:general secretion pathway protein N
MAVIRVMRLLGILLASFCALAARAAAGPIDEPARPAPEVEGASAPATEGIGVAGAGLSGASRALDPGETPRSGNPLWALPLSALTATRDRPLFSASRRPPIVALPIAAPPQKQEALAPPPPERPLFMLIGTIVSRKASVGPSASLAIVQNLATQAMSGIRVGEEESGWRLRSVSARSIMVEKGPEAFSLELPRLPEKEGQPAPEKQQTDEKGLGPPSSSN